MQTLQPGVATRRFSQPLRPSIQTAAEIGADGVQFDARSELKPADLSETGRRQLLHYLDELNLRVSSICFAPRTTLYEPQRLDARLNAIKEAMRFAFQMKARVLNLRIGRIPADTDSADYGILCELLDDLAEHGNRVGTVPAITPSGDSAEKLLQLVSRITQGEIGIDFDPALFVLAGQKPAEALRTLHAVVRHVQLRDAVGGAAAEAGMEVPLGRGEVEWDELLALLDEAGYRGWMTVDRTQGDDKTGDISRALKFIRNVALG